MSHAQDSLDCFPLSITSSPALAPSGTRAITNESEPMMIGAATSPIMTCGRSDLANPLPRICNSPPAMAAAGETCEIWGPLLEGLRSGITNTRLKHPAANKTSAA